MAELSIECTILTKWMDGDTAGACALLATMPPGAQATFWGHLTHLAHYIEWQVAMAEFSGGNSC